MVFMQPVLYLFLGRIASKSKLSFLDVSDYNGWSCQELCDAIGLIDLSRLKILKIGGPSQLHTGFIYYDFCPKVLVNVRTR